MWCLAWQCGQVKPVSAPLDCFRFLKNSLLRCKSVRHVLLHSLADSSWQSHASLKTCNRPFTWRWVQVLLYYMKSRLLLSVIWQCYEWKRMKNILIWDFKMASRPLSCIYAPFVWNSKALLWVGPYEALDFGHTVVVCTLEPPPGFESSLEVKVELVSMPESCRPSKRTVFFLRSVNRRASEAWPEWPLRGPGPSWDAPMGSPGPLWWLLRVSGPKTYGRGLKRLLHRAIHKMFPLSCRLTACITKQVITVYNQSWNNKRLAVWLLCWK